MANPFIAAIVSAGAAAPPQDAYLWPCNVATWDAWCAVQTQWRHGMGGPTGLDYAAVLAYLHAHLGAPHEGAGGSSMHEVFAGIRAAERATLTAWAEKARAEQAAAG